MSRHAFSDLRLATYCPRKLYYARREDDRSPPGDVEARRDLAFRYEESLAADDATLASLPIAVEPERYRRALSRARERLDAWPELCDPAARNVLLTGRECRGVVHKVLADPPRPALVSPGTPPDTGVWKRQSVHAVAAAKALAWERGTEIDRAYVEYPAHGAIRRVPLTTRRKAAYRSAIRTVEELDGPPPRLQDRSKCGACEYSDECGVRTRTLSTLLGFD